MSDEDDRYKYYKFKAAKRAREAQAPQAVATPAPMAEPAYEEPSGLQRARHIAGGAAQIPFDIMDLPNTATRGVGWLAEQAGIEGAEDWPDIPKFSNVVGVNAVKRLLTDPQVDRETDPKTDAARTFASWASPAIVAKAQKLSAVPDILAGIGATAGEYFGDQLGEVAGGIGGYIAGALRGKFSGATAADQATDFISDHLDETPDVIGQLAKTEGAPGTLADRLESGALYNMESTLGQKGSGLRRAIDKQVAEAESVMRDKVMGNLPTAPTALSKATAAKRVEETQAGLDVDAQTTIQQAMQEMEAAKARGFATESKLGTELADEQARVNSLRAEADAGQAAIDSGLSPTKASEASYAENLRLDAKLKVLEKAAWKKVDDGPPVDVSEPAWGLDDFVGTLNLTPNADSKFRKAYKSELDQIDTWKERKVKPNEVQDVLRDIKQKVHDAGVTGSRPYEHTVADKVGKYVQDALEGGAAGPDFTAAIKTSRDRNLQAKPEKIRKIRTSPNVETYVSRLGLTGEEGANTARLLVESKDTANIKAMHENLRAAGSAAEGGVDNKFMKKYRGYLEVFPKLKAEFQAVADATEGAVKAEKATGPKQKGLERAIAKSEAERGSSETLLTAALAEVSTGTKAMKGKAGKTSVAEFASNAEGKIKSLLSEAKGDISTKELTELHTWAKSQGDDVAESFQAQVKQQLLDKLFPKTGDTRVASNKSINNFNAIKDRLVDSGILPQKVIDSISESLTGTMTKQQYRKDAGKIEIDPKLTGRERGAATAGALVIVASTGMPHALLATRFTRDLIETEMKNRRLSAAAKEKIAEFLVNPEAYSGAYKLLVKAREKGGKLDQEKMANILRAVYTASQADDDE